MLLKDYITRVMISRKCTISTSSFVIRKSAVVSLTLVILFLLLSLKCTTGWSSETFVSRRSALKQVGMVVAGSASTSSLVALIGNQDIAAAAIEEDPIRRQKEDDEMKEQQEKERQAILQKMKERRQLMEASRSSNSRQSYLDLSKQRAALYNTTYQGVTFPPNIPCL